MQILFSTADSDIHVQKSARSARKRFAKKLCGRSAKPKKTQSARKSKSGWKQSKKHSESKLLLPPQCLQPTGKLLKRGLYLERLIPQLPKRCRLVDSLLKAARRSAVSGLPALRL